MKKCSQCGTPVPEEKAYCDICAKTLAPTKAKKRQPTPWEAATTTIPVDPSKRKRKASKTDPAKKPNVFNDLYWGKRKRMDDE